MVVMTLHSGVLGYTPWMALQPCCLKICCCTPSAMQLRVSSGGVRALAAVSAAFASAHAAATWTEAIGLFKAPFTSPIIARRPACEADLGMTDYYHRRLRSPARSMLLSQHRACYLRLISHLDIAAKKGRLLELPKLSALLLALQTSRQRSLIE